MPLNTLERVCVVFVVFSSFHLKYLFLFVLFAWNTYLRGKITTMKKKRTTEKASKQHLSRKATNKRRTCIIACQPCEWRPLKLYRLLINTASCVIYSNRYSFYSGLNLNFWTEKNSNRLNWTNIEFGMVFGRAIGDISINCICDWFFHFYLKWLDWTPFSRPPYCDVHSTRELILRPNNI